MDNLLVQEESYEVMEGNKLAQIYDSGVFLSIFKSQSDVYRYGLKHFGKCIGRVYVGDGHPVGYAFEKRVKYVDSDNTYLQQTILTIHESQPVRRIEYHYA